MLRRGSLFFVLLFMIFWGCAKNYSLIIDSANGNYSVLNDSKSVADLSKIRAGSILHINVVANEGYKFLNWSGDVSGDKNPIIVVMDGNKKIVANFNRFYQVLFNSNGGTGDMEESGIVNETTCKLPKNIFKKANSIFLGWAESPDGSVRYLDESDYSVSSSVAILYAVWEELEFVDIAIPASGIVLPLSEWDNITGSVLKSYKIAKIEVSYKLWKSVYDWAMSKKGYVFANKGRQGGDAVFVSDVAVGTDNNPVTTISWRDAVVWCNAFTEYYNEMEKPTPLLECVYYIDENYGTPLRISTSDATLTSTTKGSQDCPYIKASVVGNTDINSCNVTGYRLPTNAEWECAGRWQGTTNLNDNYVEPKPAGCTEGYFWTKGNSISGGLMGATYPGGSAQYAVSARNSGKKTADVKTKLPNALGIYDMSGNVWEWSWDWINSDNKFRMVKGGCFSSSDYNMQLGYYSSLSPNYADARFGFRISRF